MAPWRPASAASPYRHAVSPARSHVSTEPSDPYRLSESATRTSNDAYGDYHEIEKIMQRERREHDRMQAQKAELKEAERRAFVAERRAEAAERAAAESAREAEAEVAVAEEVATQAVVAKRDARRALEAARAEVEGYRQTLSEMGTPPTSPLSARSLRATPQASPHRPDDGANPGVRASPQPAKIAELVNALAQADAKAERHRVIADGLRVDLDAAAAALDVERGARLAAEAVAAAHEQKRMDAVERLLRRAKDGAALRSDVATPTRSSRGLIVGALTPNDSHDVASAAAAAPGPLRGSPELTRAEEDLVALEREHAIELDHLRTQLAKSKAETDATRRALDAARAAEEAAVLERDAAAMAGAVAERDLALLERGRAGREGRRALRRVLEELDAIERRSAGIYKVAASAIDLNRRMCEAIEAMPVRSGRWLGDGSSDEDDDEEDPRGFRAVDRGVEQTWRVGRDVLQEAWHHTRGEMRQLRREARTLGAQLERAALAEVKAKATASMYRSHDSRLSSDFDKGFAVGNRLAARGEVNRGDGVHSARSSWESRTFAPATTRSRPERSAEVRTSAEVRRSVSRDRLHSRASSARSSAATSLALESNRRGRTTTTTTTIGPGSSNPRTRSPSASPARMGSVRSSAVGSIASGFQGQSPSSSFGGAGATRRSRSVPRGGAMASSADRFSPGRGRSPAAKRRVFAESPGRSVGRARSASAGRTVPIASPVAAYIRGEAPADARPEPRRRGLTARDYSDASRSKSPGSSKERLKNVILRRGPAGEPRPRDGKTPSQRLAEIQAQRRIPAPSKGKTGKQAKSARPLSAPGTRDSSESRFAKSPARSPAKYLRKGGAYEVASRYKSPKGKVDLMPVHRQRSPRKPQGRYAL